LAELLIQYTRLDAKRRKQVLNLAAELHAEMD
jgi:hypothetical protein